MRKRYSPKKYYTQGYKEWMGKRIIAYLHEIPLALFSREKFQRAVQNFSREIVFLKRFRIPIVYNTKDDEMYV